MTTTHQDLDPATQQRVRLQPPPPALMRIVNVGVRRALRTRVLGRRLRGKALLEFTGRRSGRRLQVPACLHSIGDESFVLTSRAWRHNFAGGARVVVTEGGARRPATATLLDAAPTRVGQIVRAALDAGATNFDIGLRVARGVTPTAADLSLLPLGVIQVTFDQ